MLSQSSSNVSGTLSTLDVDIFNSGYKANSWYLSELESAFSVGAQMMFWSFERGFGPQLLDAV